MTEVYKFGDKKKDGITKKDAVRLLDESYFDVKSGKLKHKQISKGITTIMFYADWCGHCRKAKPVYANISNITQCQVNTAAVDCDKHKDLIDKLNNSESSESGFNVRGYPTFVQYKDGKYWRTCETSPHDGVTFTKFICGVHNYFDH